MKDGCYLVEMNSTTIEKIEKALSIKLYEQQKEYLINGTPIYGGRQNGKTLAYCIDLALSDGQPLNMSFPDKFCDLDYGSESNKVSYARNFFKRMFLDVRDNLSRAGFPVRAVEFKPIMKPRLNQWAGWF